MNMFLRGVNDRNLSCPAVSTFVVKMIHKERKKNFHMLPQICNLTSCPRITRVQT
jgi:hypothetical protein